MGAAAAACAYELSGNILEGGESLFQFQKELGEQQGWGETGEDLRTGAGEGGVFEDIAVFCAGVSGGIGGMWVTGRLCGRWTGGVAERTALRAVDRGSAARRVVRLATSPVHLRPHPADPSPRTRF